MITETLTNDIHQSYIDAELIFNAKVNTDPSVVKITNSSIYHIRIMDYLHVENHSITNKGYKTYYKLARNLDDGQYSLTISNKITNSFSPHTNLVSNYTLKEFKLLILQHQYDLIEKYLDTELLETIVSHVINLHVVQVKKTPKEIQVPMQTTNDNSMMSIDPAHVDDLAGDLFARPISYHFLKTVYDYEYKIIPYREGMQLITSTELKELKGSLY